MSRLLDAYLEIVAPLAETAVLYSALYGGYELSWERNGDGILMPRVLPLGDVLVPVGARLPFVSPAFSFDPSLQPVETAVHRRPGSFAHVDEIAEHLKP